jgi:hypothetical protein
MTNNDILEQLKTENEQLQFQLKDLEYFIEIKEEELVYLKNKAKSVAEMQSALDQRLYEIEQMQHFIGNIQQKSIGDAKREANLEDELIQNIKIEKEFYELRDQFKSTALALEDTTNQLSEASELYKKLNDCNSKIAALESNLEIALLDNQFLKEELEELRSNKSNTNQE